MMQRFATLLFFFFLAFCSGCSKDVLKQYDKRVIGTWRISAVNRIGIGGSTDNLAFREGNLRFEEGGVLTYVHPTGTRFRGSWDIIKKYRHQDDVQRVLQLTVVNAATQELLTAYYDDMVFLGTDHFRATMTAGLQTYITHFRR